jgi:hypothetical protein
MCDYSLQNVRTRPAKVGDKLTTRRFNYSTLGPFSPTTPPKLTEISSSAPVTRLIIGATSLPNAIASPDCAGHCLCSPD